MDYMGFHDLFDHLLTPSKKSGHAAKENQGHIYPSPAVFKKTAAGPQTVNSRPAVQSQKS
jgi:hypothetical protein